MWNTFKRRSLQVLLSPLMVAVLIMCTLLQVWSWLKGEAMSVRDFFHWTWRDVVALGERHTVVALALGKPRTKETK
jgi:hypothetical protein